MYVIYRFVYIYKFIFYRFTIYLYEITYIFEKFGNFSVLSLAKVGNFDLQFEQKSGIVFIFAASTAAFDSFRIFIMSRVWRHSFAKG